MDGTIAEIRMFAANFAPRYWAICSGQLMAINSNQALFSILGTTYGGNGQTTFALPDLRGKVAVGVGASSGGGGPYQLGQAVGTQSTVLTAANLPSHNHPITGTIKMPTTAQPANAPNPGSHYFANDGSARFNPTGSGIVMKPANLNLTVQTIGNSTGLNNMMPYTAITHIICLVGVFPSRT